MAVPVLKRSHGIVWLPPRSVGERALVSEPVLRVTHGGDAQRGRWLRCSLEAMPELKSVTLVFDARDVTLLEPSVPALPPGKLLKAMPNIVEDLLLSDVGQCAFALGPSLPDQRRLVAVIDRHWLEAAIGAFERRGMTVSAAWPAQTCLPLRGEADTLACVGDGLVLRTGPHTALAWSASPNDDQREEALQALLAAGGHPAERALRICIDDDAWRPVIERVLGTTDAKRLRVTSLPQPEGDDVDLLDARAGSAHQRWLANVDWRAWRVPAALAAGCVLAALIGLNLHWGQLAQERKSLQAQMERRVRQAFPNAPADADPMLVMQRNVGALRARAGQSGPEDFLPLLARFGQALGPGAADALTGVEYRDGQLRVKFPPSRVESRAMRDALLEACRRRGLVLKFDNDTDPVASVRIAS